MKFGLWKFWFHFSYFSPPGQCLVSFDRTQVQNPSAISSPTPAGMGLNILMILHDLSHSRPTMSHYISMGVYMRGYLISGWCDFPKNIKIQIVGYINTYIYIVIYICICIYIYILYHYIYIYISLHIYIYHLFCIIIYIYIYMYNIRIIYYI